MSDYRVMRILLFFDLPMDDSTAVRQYARFRKLLIKSGYQMFQYSVYCKICPNRDTVNWHIDYLNKHLPSDGSVMMLLITEKQYQSIRYLVGSKKALDKKITSEKLLLF